MKRYFLVFLLLSLVLGGCGTDDASDTQPDYTATSAPTPSAQTTPKDTSPARESVMVPDPTPPASSEETPAPAHTYTEDSIEYKVACLDAGTAVNPNGPETARVGVALDALGKRFRRGRTELADICAKGHELMANKGTNEPIVTIMENVAANAPSGTNDLNGLVAAYVIERTGK